MAESPGDALESAKKRIFPEVDSAEDLLIPSLQLSGEIRQGRRSRITVIPVIPNEAFELLMKAPGS
ncbi:hypothetical protein V2J09_023436 [Rumex salicifolius]